MFQVIKTLDPKQNTGPEVQALKNQLLEKERYIEQLEVSWDKPFSLTYYKFSEVFQKGHTMYCKSTFIFVWLTFACFGEDKIIAKVNSDKHLSENGIVYINIHL